MPTRFSSRQDLLDFIEREGGLQAALEYGITEADMPRDDLELRSGWYFLRIGFELAQRHADYIERVLRIPVGTPLYLPGDLPMRTTALLPRGRSGS